MYILAVGAYKEDYTGYAVNTLDDVADLLLNEEFLSKYNHYFEDGITGFRCKGQRRVGYPVELLIQYLSWDGSGYDEITFYLHELKVIGE